ncbi:hypothetical protein WJX73_002458 [Symbiochloris irregularis]|uniref:Uncharacterized protein n=1 Tax=Symbiochloris irregularis TaxID=706552 RepID=A0AAW1NZC3_9CHLO
MLHKPTLNSPSTPTFSPTASPFTLPHHTRPTPPLPHVCIRIQPLVKFSPHSSLANLPYFPTSRLPFHHDTSSFTLQPPQRKTPRSLNRMSETPKPPTLLTYFPTASPHPPPPPLLTF